MNLPELPNLDPPKFTPNTDFSEYHKQRDKEKAIENKKFWAVTVIAILSLVVAIWQLAISSKSSQPQLQNQTPKSTQQKISHQDSTKK